MPGHQRDRTAAHAERGGDRRQRRLGGLAVHGPGGDPDDQGTGVPAAGPGRAEPGWTRIVIRTGLD